MLTFVITLVIAPVEALRLRPCLHSFTSGSLPVQGCRFQPARLNANIGLKSSWYRVGDVVEAFCEDDSHWYAGVVDQVNSDGTCQVKWDRPTGALPYSTCPQELMTKMIASEEYKVGDVVEAQFPGDGNWYPGKVISNHGNGNYDIAWDDPTGAATSVCNSLAVRRLDSFKERLIDLDVARELLEQHGFPADLLDEEALHHLPQVLDGVREAERRLQQVQPQFWQTTKRTCAVCGAPAGGASGHAEEVPGERENPWVWWPPGMHPKVTARLRSCSSRKCRFALALGAAWRRQAQVEFDTRRPYYGVHIGAKSLSLGVKAFEGSSFHYLIAAELHASPELRVNAIHHLQRIVDAQPKHLWATVDLHYLCSRMPRGELPQGLSAHLHPEVRGYFLERACEQLLGSPEKALERAILRMLQEDPLAAMRELPTARENPFQQRLGAATAGMMRHMQINDVEVLTDKGRLAKLQLRHSPPSVLLLGTDGTQDSDGIRDSIRETVQNYVSSFGLQDRRHWMLKEVGEEAGYGLQEVWSDAQELDQNVALRLEELHKIPPSEISRSRSGGKRKWVLQRMVTPWLEPDGFKVGIRAYLLLSLPRGGTELRAWIYSDGLVNLASEPYTAGTRAATIVHGGSSHKHRPLTSFPEYKEWFPQIHQITEELIRASHSEILQYADEEHDSWHHYGVDLIPEEDGRLWLLEVNGGPVLWVGEGIFKGTEEAWRLTRTMLLDVVDVRVRSQSKSEMRNEPNAENGFVPLLVEN